MCGIAGAFSSRDVRGLVAQMSEAVRHRGPDGEGLASITRANGAPAGAFGHRRLAILDPSPAGLQPMRTPDGRYTLSYNGELYNFLELREELRREGAVFRSDTDTEVLLLGWAMHGARWLERLRGMFAFAMWDGTAGRGWLVRDPFGIKPLYAARSGEDVLFASEIRALLASGRLSGRLSREAVAGYLATGSAIEPFTIIEDVQALPAGTLSAVTVEDGIARLGEPVPYAAPAPFPAPDAHREQDERVAHLRVRDAIRDSVVKHLVSDVPVGLFLSGGLDSSALVALASEAGAVSLETFTVTFSELGFDESRIARLVARRYRTSHHEIPLTGADLLGALPAAFLAMDQPSMDGINTFVVSAAVRAHGVKVALSGLGGDELFAGYPSFRRAARLRPFWRMPRALRSATAAMAERSGGMRASKAALLMRETTPARAAYRASRMLFGAPRVIELTGGQAPPPAPAPPDGLSLLEQVSWYETTGYMRNVLLRDGDVFSMAHGLELRVPLVDLEVAAAAAVVDPLRLRPRVQKPLLLGAVRDLLPREVWDRPKQGFALPFDRWMRADLRHEVEAAFTGDRFARVGMDVESARQVWARFLRREVGWSRPWALYTLVRWAEVNDLAAAGSASVLRISA